VDVCVHDQARNHLVEALARYAPAVRALALLLLAACKPSATIQATSPVANLQSYQTVGVVVHTNQFASQGMAQMLEASVVGYLQQGCGFSSVGRLGNAKPDVKLDLTITSSRRGGDGVITNPNTAVVDTLVVLSDGQAGDLLGTMRIRGKSSGMIVNNNLPENQAIDVVAKTIGEVFIKSGCSGPRVAKAVPLPDNPLPPADPNHPGPTIDESKRPQAEQLNDQGKEKLYAADLAGALALFQQAAAVLPDAKYQFNVCLALGAQEQWDPALAACRQAKTMNPNAQLAEKIDRRIDLLQKRQ
jgi:tetratricopeptide (TPR) repeat protein